MPVLEWPEPTRSPQFLEILIKDTWGFSVSSASPQEFGFEGHCATSPLKDLTVYSEFESYSSRSSLLYRLPDSWRSMPDLADTIVEGWGYIMGIDRHEPGFPTLRFHLFCTPEGWSGFIVPF
jgi:hypothetical protein